MRGEEGNLEKANLDVITRNCRRSKAEREGANDEGFGARGGGKSEREVLMVFPIY